MKQLQMVNALVKRATRGDLGAFDLLVLKYQHRIFRGVGNYVSDFHEVQDITQESFVKAFQNINKFRGESSFYTWLHRIAINTAKNYLVSSRSRRLRQVSDLNEDSGLESEKMLDLDTPDRIIHEQEVAMVIQKTLDTLSADLRTAIMLREFDGLSYESIAEIMSCPVGTVRSRIFRAREAIDNELKSLINFG